MLPTEKKNPPTKEMIIDILSIDIELTARGVHNKIRHVKPLTYHAIFKLLNQLVSENVLLKDEMHYSLNPEWIHRMKEHYQILEQSYLNKKETMLINKDSTHFVLPSIHEGFFMLMRALERGIFGDSKVVVAHFSHLLYLQLSKEETALLKRLGEDRKIYYLVNHKSPLDKMIAYYNKTTFNYETKLGVPCAEPFYLYVIGDKIVQINIPRELRDAMDKIYNHPFSTTLFPKPKVAQITTFVNEVAYKKVKIDVHVITDKSAAQDIVKRTLERMR
ncbi:hypothetical protein HZC30_02135 [Candidatus Woesearchaeota archaeon]|nr:hypothetical protein [Candidatus Woesearchaeota archaeon]